MIKVKEDHGGWYVVAIESLHDEVLEEWAFIISYDLNLSGAINKVIEQIDLDEKLSISHLIYTIVESPFGHVRQDVMVISAE